MIAAGNAEVFMTIMQFLSTFRFYQPDVLLLALGVTLGVSLLKKILPKSCPKKIYLFAPFLLGIALYGAYAVIREGNALPLKSDLAQTVDSGFSCGCVATLYYLIYEQFFRGTKKKSQPSLSTLLEGIVPEENREAALNALLNANGKEGEELSRFVRETLSEYGEKTLSDVELCASAKIIAELLPKLR